MVEVVHPYCREARIAETETALLRTVFVLLRTRCHLLAIAFLTRGTEDVSVTEVVVVDGGEESVCEHTGSCMGSMSVVCTCSVCAVCNLSDDTKKNDDKEDCTGDFFFLTGGWSS